MKFNSINDALNECNVVVCLFSTKQEARMTYPIAVSAYGKRGDIESFDPDQREIKFKNGMDVYFLSEAELQDWCIDRTYWINGWLYRSGDVIYEAEIEGEIT